MKNSYFEDAEIRSMINKILDVYQNFEYAQRSLKKLSDSKQEITDEQFENYRKGIQQVTEHAKKTLTNL